MQNDCKRVTESLIKLRDVNRELGSSIVSKEIDKGNLTKNLLEKKVEEVNSESFMKSRRYLKILSKILGPAYFDLAEKRIDWDGNVALTRKYYDQTEILTTEEETGNYIIAIKNTLKNEGTPFKIRINHTYAVQVISKAKIRTALIPLREIGEDIPVVASCGENKNGLELIIKLLKSKEERKLFISHYDDSFKTLKERVEARKGRMGI